VHDPFGNRIEIVDERDAGFTLRQPAVTGSARLFNAATADQYDRFVGRYTRELARALISAAGVRPGQRALDVGCGPGALATELAALLGQDNVAAVDPSPTFAESCRQRLPNADVRIAPGEALPFEDDSFDHALAQLVVNFMTDAPAGVGEMVRVTRSGGRVTAAVWDYRAEMVMLRRFWDAAIATGEQGTVVDEAAQMRYCEPDDLGDLLRSAGLVAVDVKEAWPSASYESFDDLWRPFEAGIGPAGAHIQTLTASQRDVLKSEFKRRLGVGDGPFELSARAWVGVGTVTS
jgi:SAM-dependent methyltransferase